MGAERPDTEAMGLAQRIDTHRAELGAMKNYFFEEEEVRRLKEK